MDVSRSRCVVFYDRDFLIIKPGYWIDYNHSIPHARKDRDVMQVSTELLTKWIFGFNCFVSHKRL